jgi:hypothetical protein
MHKAADIHSLMADTSLADMLYSLSHSLSLGFGCICPNFGLSQPWTLPTLKSAMS